MEESRSNALRQVQTNPHRYLDLVDELKSDPDICLATLLAFGNNELRNDDFFPTILEMMGQCAPEFTNHKPVLFLYMDLTGSLLDHYLQQFGYQICQNRDLIEELAKHQKIAYFFRRLPVKLRSDADLLQLAVESVPDEEFEKFLQVIPAQALVAHEFILNQVVARSTIKLDYRWVPSCFWKSRKFVAMRSEQGECVPLSLIPKEFSRDREICLLFYKNKFGRRNLESTDIKWISRASLLDDKPFVLACLGHHPKIFECCSNELQNDFDVVLEAAYGAVRLDLFGRFIESLDSPILKLVQPVHSRIRAHDELMTFLACEWKSRLISVLPLRILDCGEETLRGLATAVAQYLGCKNAGFLERLKRVWDEIVLWAIATRKPSKAVMPLVRPKELVQGVLRAIENKTRVNLHSFPHELWTIHSFVKWAAINGKFHDAIPHAFSEDWKLCYMYFAHSSEIREKTWPWISDTVKSNRTFLFKCSSIDPMILVKCCSEAIRHDFEVLLSVVFHAAKWNRLNGLVDAARVGGWADSLISFAKSVRAKLEAQIALDAFKAEAKSRYFAHVPAKDSSRLTKMIGANLGIATHRKHHLCKLERIWSCQSIFFLALGGSIDELCEANKFRKQLPPRRNDEDSSSSSEDSDSAENDDIEEEEISGVFCSAFDSDSSASDSSSSGSSASDSSAGSDNDEEIESW